MYRTSGVSLVVLAVAVAVAAPAAADQDSYLGPLLIRYSSLTSQQLLTESSKVCATVGTGKSASVAIPMVQNDLRVSVPEALDVIVAAVAFRHC